MNKEKVVKVIIVVAVIVAIIVGLSMLRGTPAKITTPVGG
jgi:hypothetical protein